MVEQKGKLLEKLFVFYIRLGKFINHNLFSLSHNFPLKNQK